MPGTCRCLINCLLTDWLTWTTQWRVIGSYARPTVPSNGHGWELYDPMALPLQRHTLLHFASHVSFPPSFTIHAIFHLRQSLYNIHVVFSPFPYSPFFEHLPSCTGKKISLPHFISRMSQKVMGPRLFRYRCILFRKCQWWPAVVHNWNPVLQWSSFRGTKFTLTCLPMRMCFGHRHYGRSLRAGKDHFIFVFIALEFWDMYT